MCSQKVRTGCSGHVLLSVLALLVSGLPAFAQRPTGPPPPSGATSSSPLEQPADLQVSVRETSGMPLSRGAIVKIDSYVGALHLFTSTQEGATATFPNVPAGDYEIEVEAAGYKTTTERAWVLGGPTSIIYVYLALKGEAQPGNRPSSAPIMTPRLQSEIHKGLDKMRQRQYDAARAHFEKGAKIAPGNPDIQYLLGMLEYVQEHFDAARVKFEAALSINPTHERSLVTLGELQLRGGEPAAAAQTLEKAYQVNGADWRVHLLLADAYFLQKNYEKARPHAARAAELGKERGASARVLLGRILFNEGAKDGAKRAFESVIRDFPKEPSAQEAQTLLAALNRPVAAPVSLAPSPAVPAPQPPPPAVVRPWAPPDIDSKEYPAVEDVSCSEADLIKRTQARTMRQLGNFEKFTATEHIEHQEVDAYGTPGPLKARDFNYLVFIERPSPGIFFLDEQRDGGENLESFPTSLATRGLVSLGVGLFDPNYEGDFVYKCEGLGAWRGNAAWRMRFEQHKERPSRIRTWRNGRGRFAIPLKGRVWINASSYDVLHLETDLREPVPDLQLSRDHLLIDYGPVQFNNGKTSLWLPWYAEMYMELRGKRYHHRHTLTNYMLFSVETQNTIAPPKNIPDQ